jgi:hypothetical protein
VLRGREEREEREMRKREEREKKERSIIKKIGNTYNKKSETHKKKNLSVLLLI